MSKSGMGEARNVKFGIRIEVPSYVWQNTAPQTGSGQVQGPKFYILKPLTYI